MASTSTNIMSHHKEENTPSKLSVATQDEDADNQQQQQQQQSSEALLILGACGMDRLLTVARYPEPEQKVRTTEYHEVGGGNAANVAHAAALLLEHVIGDEYENNDDYDEEEGESGVEQEQQQQSLTRRRHVRRVQLATKVGSDAIGQALVQELQDKTCVDLNHSLFQMVPDSTTSFTTIIVSATEHSRTCLHTPGTCGEWSRAEIVDILDHQSLRDWNRHHNVCHFHSDARHTEAALYLAQQARRNHIPISLDVEKDRGSTALDELLELADLIFTNTWQLEDYLQRLTRELEVKEQRQPLAQPKIINRTNMPDGHYLVELLVRALRPSTYFTRRYQQRGKQVVITKGDQGSLHIQCDSVETLSSNTMPHTASDEPKAEHTITLEDDEKSTDKKDSCFRLTQVFYDHKTQDTSNDSNARCTRAVYTLSAVGILPDVTIVDTTGSGDAFCGGYLASQLHPQATRWFPRAIDKLRFATWVASQKLQGPGARTTLPTVQQWRRELGYSNPSQILRDLITPFGNPTTFA